jgi:hypothetical protein
MPHVAIWAASTRRLVALSSTISTRLPFSSSCKPGEMRCLLGGDSATDAWMVKKKVEPVPGPWLSTHMLPPINSAKRLLIARPSPVPPYFRVVLESACENDWNSRPMPCADRPMPVSRTAKVRVNLPPSRCFAATPSTTSPASVNFTALLSRFSMI